MLIAHLPAGYLLSRRLAARQGRDDRDRRFLLGLGLVASILPDFDLAYFYLIDARRTLHHDYWTHIPAFWLAAFGLSALFFRLARAPVPWAALGLLLANVLLHLALDTLAGGIAWLYPWQAGRIVLLHIPARFDWWVWNFVLHPVFFAELAIVGWAAYDFRLEWIGRKETA